MEIFESTFRDRRIWRVQNAEITLAITQEGAHIAELKSRTAENCPNLLWEPPWPTMEPSAFNPQLHGPQYGGTSESKLLSGILGHFICFPFWGDPTPTEHAAGAQYHGEAAFAAWRRVTTEDALVIYAEFPHSATAMTREIRLHGPRVNVTTEAHNVSPYDRPVAWCEHATFGPPFLEPGVTEFHATAGRGFESGQEDTPVSGHFDLQQVTAEPHSDLVHSFECYGQNGEASFSAQNSRLNVGVTYTFPASQFPWLNVWRINDGRLHARGMEFSNTPRHGTMRALIKTSHVHGVPAFDWLPGGGSLTKSFSIDLHHPLPFSEF